MRMTYASLCAAMAAAFAVSATAMERESARSEFRHYQGRGKGEGLSGNKHSMRSVAQDKRAALSALDYPDRVMPLGIYKHPSVGSECAQGIGPCKHN